MFLFFLMAFLITYGSFYPFDIVNPDEYALQMLFETWGNFTHQGDILANTVLFVPFGVTGIQALIPRFSKKIAIVIVLTLGFILGVGLQIGQIYMPSRDANLSDALLNIIGTIVGIVVALGLNKNKLSLSEVKSKINYFPIYLLLSWVAYRLMPLVPSIDLQEIKNSIKPLLLYPELNVVRVFHDVTAWLTAFYILSKYAQKYFTMRYLVIGILLCFSLEIIIVNNVVSLSNFLGASLALILWKLFFTHLKNNAIFLAIMMIGVLFVSGFSPYRLADTAHTFQWLPFYGFLGGSMLVNTSSLLEKFFLYGSLIWLLQTSGLRVWTAVIITAVVTLCIEVGQIFLTGHTPEITDSLLVFCIGYFATTVIKKEEEAIVLGTEKPLKYFCITLSLDSPYTSQQIKGKRINSDFLPIHIGRSDNSESTKNNKHQISLEDTEPYQLSRSHFSIEQENNDLFIIDTHSTKGSWVNGKQIGGNVMKQNSMKLKIGENKVIAGQKDSVFYFRIFIELEN